MNESGKSQSRQRDSLSDSAIREMLLCLDEDEDRDVTRWEADFLETAVYKWRGSYTDKQRKVAIGILAKYRLL